MNIDGTIESRDLCSSSVIERVLSDESVSSIKIKKTIQSDNFVTGSAGWQINRDTGSCEFQDAVIRGTLNASDITTGTLDASVVTVTNLNADNITTGTLSVNRIGSNSIEMNKIELTAALVASQVLRSTTYSAGTSGWQIEADGTAEFNSVTVRGDITATTGTLVDLDVSGTLDMVTGGVFRTADAGRRIEMSKASFGDLKYYSGQGSETSPASLSIDAAGTMRLNGVATATGNGYLSFGLSGSATLYASNSQTVSISGANSSDVSIASGPSGEIRLSGGDTISLSRAGNQVVEKNTSGDLYIRNNVTDGDVFLQAKNSTTLRTRITIDGNGNTAFYNRSGVEVLRIRTDNYLSVNQRIYFTHGGNDFFTYDDTINQYTMYADANPGFIFRNTGTNDVRLGVGDTSPDAGIDVSGQNAAGMTPGIQTYSNTSSTTTSLADFRSNTGASNRSQCLVKGDGDLENWNGAYSSISDERLKVSESIVLARDYSDDLRDPNLAPIKYAFKDEPDRVLLGWSAQRVQKVKPGFVKPSIHREYEMNEDGTYVRDENDERVKHDREVLTVTNSLFVPLLHSGWLAHDARLARIEQQLGIEEAV